MHTISSMHSLWSSVGPHVCNKTSVLAAATVNPWACSSSFRTPFTKNSSRRSKIHVAAMADYMGSRRSSSSSSCCHLQAEHEAHFNRIHPARQCIARAPPLPAAPIRPSSCYNARSSSTAVSSSSSHSHPVSAANPENETLSSSNNKKSSSSDSNSNSSSTANKAAKKAGSSAAGSSWVVNKEPIQSAMSPQLYSYLLSHTREPQVLADLRAETAGMHGGHMQIAPEQGQLLSLLVELLGVQSALEVGVYTGYSSLAVALALPATGRLVAFDKDPTSMAVARRYWQLAGVADKVDSRLGPALDGLQQLLKQEGEGQFDFAFIDADKRAYQAYFELCLKLVKPGGLIAVDNVLFYGKVADNNVNDKATVALRQFNEQLMHDQRVSFSIVPIGDGMALCRKR